MNEDQIYDFIVSNYEPFILKEGHPAFESSENPNWKYQKVNINQIICEYGSNNKNDILSWFSKEIKMWDREYPNEPNRWKELEKYFLTYPEDLPLILLLGKDGNFYLNDGHHRHAIALKNNLPEVWAIIAYP